MFFFPPEPGSAGLPGLRRAPRAPPPSAACQTPRGPGRAGDVRRAPRSRSRSSCEDSPNLQIQTNYLWKVFFGIIIHTHTYIYIYIFINIYTYIYIHIILLKFICYTSKILYIVHYKYISYILLYTYYVKTYCIKFMLLPYIILNYVILYCTLLYLSYMYTKKYFTDFTYNTQPKKVNRILENVHI